MRPTRPMLHQLGPHGIEEKSFTVSTDLPTLDDDVSFVVDDGAPTGPMPMRLIIDSIRSGERAPDVLVWWAGTPEWISFASDQRLFELLQVLPATNQPPPPPSIDEIDAVEEVESSSFPEPQVTSFDLPSEEAVAELADDTTAEVSTHLELDSSVVEDDVPYFDPVIEAEADVLLAGSPRELHPSSGWGIAGDPAREAAADELSLIALSPDRDEVEEFVEEFVEEVGIEQVEAAQDVEVAELAEVEHVDEVVQVEQVAELAEVEYAAEQPDVVEEAPAAPTTDSGLVGLFSAGARGARVIEQASPLESHETAVPRGSSLENVGARIDALTSATRRAQRLDYKVDESGMPDSEPQTGSWQAVEEASFDPRTALDQRFAEMVRKSVEHQRRIEWATRVDELLLSASITSIVEAGFVVVDLTTIERQHHVAFDHNDDSRRVRFDLSPMSTLNAAGDPVGRHVRVALTWGRRIVDADVAFGVVREQLVEGDVSPGTLTCEADLVHSLAFTAVDLIWAADDFVGNDHSVDRTALDGSIAAALHALEVRWHELFTAS